VSTAEFSPCSGPQSKTEHEDPCDPPCVRDPRACELTWTPHVSAVFVGKIADLKREKGTETAIFIATVEVEEGFLGVHSKTVTVVSGGDKCGAFPFSKGSRYLIYAKSQDGSTFNVTLCGGTKWFSKAGEDLKYLRALASMPPTATVSGTVFRYNYPMNPNEKTRKLYPNFRDPYAGRKVWIRSESHSYEALVEKNGNFNVAGIEPGTYYIGVQTTEPLLAENWTGLHLVDPAQKGFGITVHSGGCAHVDFTIDPFQPKTE
jgi:hypothetical protein